MKLSMGLLAKDLPNVAGAQVIKLISRIAGLTDVWHDQEMTDLM